MREAIGAAEQSKFSEFSKKVKTSLEDKLRNHPKIKDGADKIEQSNKLKDAFAKISQDMNDKDNIPVELPEPTEIPSTEE